MSDEPKLLSQEELREMVKTLSHHATLLEELLSSAREKISKLNTENSGLNTENSGWLEIYRQQLAEIDELKVAISRLESRIRGQQAES